MIPNEVIFLIAKESFENPPKTVLPLCSSNMNKTHSKYQRYLASKLVPNSSPQIECTFDRYEKLAPVKELLTNSSTIEASSLLNSFRSCACQFKAFRSTFIESLLNSDKGMGEEFNNMNIQQVNEVGFLQRLKELSTICQEICKEFIRTNPTLEDYGKFWDTYSRVIIELEFCFVPLANALNTVSSAFGERQDFSICRLMKAIFIDYCYYPLEEKFKQEFPRKLEVLVKRVVFSEEGLTKVQIVDEIQKMYLSIQGLLDMTVNEINVHYINTKQYLNKINNPKGPQEVKAQLTRCFIEVYRKIKSEELDNELIDELWSLYKKLFPLSFLDQVNKYLLDIKAEELKQAIKNICYIQQTFFEENIELYEELEKLISSVLIELNIQPNEENIKGLVKVLEEANPEILSQFESLSLYEPLTSLEEGAIIARNEEVGLSLDRNVDKLYANFN